MNRRNFLRTGGAGLLLAAETGAAFAVPRLPRVGLIGCGWYGKCDLLRLLQVAPADVVSLCDVDSKMLADAADIVATRQASNKKPRTFDDYRKMLKEKDLDVVLIATPDHWHALPMIAAVEAGADVYVQKPISVDIAEGKAMLAAARKHKRVVQVGTQRRSTPHLIEARDRIVKEGKLGKIGLVEVYCYYHMRTDANPPDRTRRQTSTRRCGPGRPRCGPTTTLVHPRSWRAFTEYGNGIIGDMCIHMLDMVRWMLGLGWPKRISSSGGILVEKRARPTSPTRSRPLSTSATSRWSGSTAPGATRPTRSIRGAPPSTATRARSRSAWTVTTSRRTARASRSTATCHGAGQVSRRPDREGPGEARRPGHPRPHAQLPQASRRAANPWPTSRKATFPRPAASWRTWRCDSAAPSPGTLPGSRWSTTTRPTNCCGDRIANRGFIPKPERQNPTPRPPPRNGEGERRKNPTPDPLPEAERGRKKDGFLFFLPSPLRGGGRGGGPPLRPGAPGQTSARRSFESPKRSRWTPARSISDRYRLHILRLGLPR